MIEVTLDGVITEKLLMKKKKFIDMSPGLLIVKVTKQINEPGKPMAVQLFRRLHPDNVIISINETLSLDTSLIQ